MPSHAHPAPHRPRGIVLAPQPQRAVVPFDTSSSTISHASRKRPASTCYRSWLPIMSCVAHPTLATPAYIAVLQDSLLGGSRSLYQGPFGSTGAAGPTTASAISSCHVGIGTKCVWIFGKDPAQPSARKTAGLQFSSHVPRREVISSHFLETAGPCLLCSGVHDQQPQCSSAKPPQYTRVYPTLLLMPTFMAR